MKRNDSNIKNIPILVTACCILHNLCELHIDACEEEWVMHDTLEDAPPSSSTISTIASRIREALWNTLKPISAQPANYMVIDSFGRE